jgi:hypothetical protein
MRLGSVLVCMAAMALAACSDDSAGRRAELWGCGPVAGLKALNGPNAPAYILVGEFTETNEAPAAFAEIACRLAAGQGESHARLYVGLSQYLGGATDAETRMQQRLEALKAKGAPIVLGVIGADDHPYAIHNRDKAEKIWAENLMAKVKAAGANRALFLMPRTDAIAEPLAPSGDRFAGYSPMPVFLPRQEVLSLEVAINPIPGAPGPEIRVYSSMRNGFHGEVALASLTHPELKIAFAKSDDAANRIWRPLTIPEEDLRAILAPGLTHDQKVDRVTAYLLGQFDRYAAQQVEIQKAADSYGKVVSVDPFMRDLLARGWDEVPPAKDRPAKARALAETLVSRMPDSDPPIFSTSVPDPVIPEPLVELPDFTAK